jgi:TonB family protein
MRSIIIFILLFTNVFVFGQGPDTSVSSPILIDERKFSFGDEVYESFACDTKPVFPGSDTALINYVKNNIKYPLKCKEEGIEGTVYVRFIVTKTGTIGSVSVMRAVNPLLEEEAIRIVKSLPKWTPSIKDGKQVNVWFIIPVTFRLD